jgi:hypothetical protein
MGANPIPEPHGRKDEVDEKFQWFRGGIEDATFRLAAQCLNQLRHCRPPHRPQIFKCLMFKSLFTYKFKFQQLAN